MELETLHDLHIHEPKDTERKKGEMKIANRKDEKGGMGYILLWLLGVPIPVLLIIFLVRGCT
jgi:hypothetical protein